MNTDIVFILLVGYNGRRNGYSTSRCKDYIHDCYNCDTYDGDYTGHKTGMVLVIVELLMIVLFLVILMHFLWSFSWVWY